MVILGLVILGLIVLGMVILGSVQVPRRERIIDKNKKFITRLKNLTKCTECVYLEPVQPQEIKNGYS